MSHNIPTYAPLRVDFAGGWLDVPRFSRAGEYIVNCAISPCVSLTEWPYETRAGLGGSGAWALLNGQDGVASELDMGVGWQDPAVITTTGLCVWSSGMTPLLNYKQSGEFLKGHMAILWTGKQHDTPDIVNYPRDYDMIAMSSRIARDGVINSSLQDLAKGMSVYHLAQLDEGMESLPTIRGELAHKYCGGGHGGYALYIFTDQAVRAEAIEAYTNLRAVEPFCKS